MIDIAISKAGICARTIAAEHLGLLQGGQTPEFLRLAAREGNRHEQFIREDLPEHGYISMFPERQYCLLCKRDGIHIEYAYGNYNFRGHIDDMVYPVDNPSNFMIAEYKALGRFTFDKITRHGIENHKTYAIQESLYQLIMRQELLYVIKNRDTGRMTLQKIKEPLWDIDSIATRLDEIFDYPDMAIDNLPPCDSRESLDNYACTSLCDRERNENIPNYVLPARISKAVQDFRAAKILENTSNQMITEARGIFQAYLLASGNKSITVDGLRITRVKEGVTVRYNVPDHIKQEYKEEKPRPGYIAIRDLHEA